MAFLVIGMLQVMIGFIGKRINNNGVHIYWNVSSYDGLRVVMDFISTGIDNGGDGFLECFG